MNLIKRFEGYAKRLKNGDCTTYLCAAGVMTIGYGSTGGFSPGAVWTEPQANARFLQDVKKFAVGVFALSPGLMLEPENRQQAIISFAYNCGLNAYKNSTLRKAVNRQDWEEATRQLLKWDNVKGKPVRGLTLRRRAEADLLLA
jgi:lysozyme